MAQTPMDGSVTLSFQREPSYFDANCVLGSDRQTIICRDAELNEIVGLGTRSVREMFVDGKTTRVGYLSSLRSVKRARNRGLLARGYRLLRKLHEADSNAPEYYLTTIAEDNTVAINQLTSGRAGLPTYHQLSRLHTLVLPIRRRTNGSKLEAFANCRISPPHDMLELVEFLNARGLQKTFFPRYQPNDFEPGGGTFRGLQTSSIVVARRNERIIGAAGVWDQRAFRQTLVSDYKPAVRLLRPLLNTWSRLSGGIQLPSIGKTVEACFVCFPVVSVDEPAVFDALLRQLMRVSPADAHCLLLGLCDDDPLYSIAQTLSRSQYTTRLYAVSWLPMPSSVVAPSAKPYYLELGCL